jgi:hypothetical protein
MGSPAGHECLVISAVSSSQPTFSGLQIVAAADSGDRAIAQKRRLQRPAMREQEVVSPLV